MAIATSLALGLGGLALGGASAFMGAKSQRKAANTAADAQAQATAQNNALARDIYGQNRAALAPFQQNVEPANALMAGALGYGNTGFYKDMFRNFIQNSDYGFQFGEGANKVNSGFAGAGTLQSGAAMKALEDYRQNLQSGYRGEFNSLIGSQQGLGLGAASALAGVGTNYSNAVMANNQNAGDAAANAALVKGQNSPFANALGLMGGGLYGLGG